MRSEPSEQLELGVRGLAHLAVHPARDDLEHAVAALAQHRCERGQLGLVGERARHLVAATRVVGEDARRRDAERARIHACARDVDHRREVVGGRDAGAGAVTHHVRAHRRVRDVCPDVHHARSLGERVEVLGERFPPPVDALPQRGAGDVLDALHELDELLLATGVHRREPHAAVADHDRGHAVPARRPELRVPRGLAVVVRVHVDEARGHQQAVGVDGLAGRSVDLPDLGDPPVGHCDVAGERVVSESVDDRAAADHEIMHVSPSGSPSFWRPYVVIVTR